MTSEMRSRTTSIPLHVLRPQEPGMSLSSSSRTRASLRSHELAPQPTLYVRELQREGGEFKSAGTPHVILPGRHSQKSVR